MVVLGLLKLRNQSPGPRATQAERARDQTRLGASVVFPPTFSHALSNHLSRDGEGTYLGAESSALGIIISLLNSIHSAFDFLNAVSIFNLVSIPIKLSVCCCVSPARFNCPYLNSLIKSIVCFQIL